MSLCTQTIPVSVMQQKIRALKKSWLHGCEPEEDFAFYVAFEEGFVIFINNPVSAVIFINNPVSSTVTGIALLQHNV